MADFRMPALGADMDEGTITEWRVGPGDSVRRGDIVAVVDTSKAEIEIEIFDDAVIDELVVPAGERVPVGAVIATFTPSAASRRPPPQLRPLTLPPRRQLARRLRLRRPPRLHLALSLRLRNRPRPRHRR